MENIYIRPRGGHCVRDIPQHTKSSWWLRPISSVLATVFRAEWASGSNLSHFRPNHGFYPLIRIAQPCEDGYKEFLPLFNSHPRAIFLLSFTNIRTPIQR